MVSLENGVINVRRGNRPESSWHRPRLDGEAGPHMRDLDKSHWFPFYRIPDSPANMPPTIVQNTLTPSLLT